MNITNINEILDLFFDYLCMVCPKRHIQMIMQGDYPKVNKPAIFYSYALGTPKNAGVKEHVFNKERSIETVLTDQIITFSVDVLGGAAGYDAQRISNLLWHSNTWKNIFLKSGLGSVSQIRNLSKLESGNFAQRYQLDISLNCTFENSLTVEQFIDFSAKIKKNDDDKEIFIKIPNERECT